VVVDAVFGTGFRGALEGEPLDAIRAMASCDAAVVAVDIPSGVNGESGAVERDAVVADVTVTFGAPKPGVVLFPGAAFAGEVRVADIGFPPDLVRSDLGLVEPEDAAVLLPARGAEANKRSTGVVLVVAGSRAMTGAGILTARAAYRAGAGLVTLAAPESALGAAKAALIESTFLPLPETDGGGASEDAWGPLTERFGSVHALAVGPGLGRDPATSALVRRLVAESPVPFVLDADGLNAFAGRGDDLARRTSDCVVTPHDGEFARLTGAAVADVREDRIGHARKAAASFGCAVLLKGPRTIVAEPSGRARVNATGGPWLATGGTGDVLTGALATFIARGLPPADAAVLAAFAHGVAGELAGAERGEGALASDVLERLPVALEALRRLRDERDEAGDGRSSLLPGDRGTS
jgi:NAD(P)H-hydrate epimerase